MNAQPNKRLVALAFLVVGAVLCAGAAGCQSKVPTAAVPPSLATGTQTPVAILQGETGQDAPRGVPSSNQPPDPTEELLRLASQQVGLFVKAVEEKEDREKRMHYERRAREVEQQRQALYKKE